MLSLAFRNDSTGKLEEKKLVSFTNEAMFKVASEALEGQMYEVVAEKGEQYWEWKSMTPIAPGDVKSSAGGNGTQNYKNTNTSPAARTYETAEERAERQILIVRQSSLSAAVASLTAGAKAPPKTDEVLQLAQQYTDFIFQKNAGLSNSMFTSEELADIPNDL